MCKDNHKKFKHLVGNYQKMKKQNKRQDEETKAALLQVTQILTDVILLPDIHVYLQPLLHSPHIPFQHYVGQTPIPWCTGQTAENPPKVQTRKQFDTFKLSQKRWVKCFSPELMFYSHEKTWSNLRKCAPMRLVVSLWWTQDMPQDTVTLLYINVKILFGCEGRLWISLMLKRQTFSNIFGFWTAGCTYHFIQFKMLLWAMVNCDASLIADFLQTTFLKSYNWQI